MPITVDFCFVRPWSLLLSAGSARPREMGFLKDSLSPALLLMIAFKLLTMFVLLSRVTLTFPLKLNKFIPTTADQYPLIYSYGSSALTSISSDFEHIPGWDVCPQRDSSCIHRS